MARMTDRTVLTIGNFDGVHRGHQQILATARRLADELGAAVVAMTFEPHPATLLRPDEAPLRLLPLERRRQYLLDAGADRVEVVAVTRDFLQQSAEAFLQGLFDRHRPAAIVEGRAFRFGHDRRGDVATINAFGRPHGLRGVPVDPVEVALSDLLVAPVSSSLVRWLVSRGRVVDAAICLGRPHALAATVVRGEQRGRTIGVPTVNLDSEELAGYVLPADGVYAGVAILADGERHAAAISVGVKPTFGQRRRTIEAHLLDFTPASELYGQRVELQWRRWVRDQLAFPSLAALRQQLGRDLAAVRALHLTDAAPTLRRSA